MHGGAGTQMRWADSCKRQNACISPPSTGCSRFFLAPRGLSEGIFISQPLSGP